MNAEEILSRLVAFSSVAGRPNAAITGWIGELLEQAGARVRMIPGPEGDRANVFASFGPRDRAGVILSGHMDVVPAQAGEWVSDPFVLTERDGRLHARGSSDMLGFLACVLAIAPELGRRTDETPVHIAFSYDEELGCRGVPHLLARLPELCAPALGAVIGEPTSLVPVRGHKGKAAIGIRVTGQSGHSSRPDLGLNAIHGLAPVLDEVVATARALQSGPQSAEFAPPWSTVQAGVIAGGQAVNIIPDLATLEIEARAIPGVDPLAVLAPVLTRLEALTAEGYGIEHVLRSSYPALRLAADHPMVARVEAAAGQGALAAVSFGTEAGLFQQAGVPAVICGPGDIGRAHKPDEYITRDELAAGVVFLRNLVASLD
ncbi:acetylornithine deacetylase [Paenirhodobacter populi]|uniref:Acetylornithine deacetylase n=1 Tax=Paenirhodobacter populi TaxID=2306993 RepID=A0A443IZ63_9RHOB|nr:acetylornithine deacetylase [Sinirhodobacter populi]RWR13420.1 acetylornithine deacetylase [Sinirhodobacter populi]